MNQGDKTKLIPYIDYVEKELSFLPEYEREVDWKTYYSLRSKRLEIERWIECLINAALDISKMFLTITGETIPETSREVLFQMGACVYGIEAEAEAFSELAKIRNTLAHRYLDIRWRDIKRFLQVAPNLYPAFIDYVKKRMEGER
ncbi:MAG: HepT-like ribonuclease domain-containing protein [Pseudomonadota bacterium]